MTLLAASLADGIGRTFGDTVLSGSLVAAIPVAMIAGLVSFLSPCVVPLVPSYLAYVSGLSASEIVSGRRARVVLGAFLFVAGFTVVFASYGALFGGLGTVLVRHGDVISQVLGGVVIVLGLMFAGWLPGMSREFRLDVKPSVGLVGAPVLGATFAIGWTACMGPTLAAVQLLAFTEGSAGRGALLSVFYCLGLGIPFLAVAFGYSRSMRAIAWIRERQAIVMRVGGLVLIGLGLLLVTGLWADIVRSLQGWIGGFEVIV